MLQDVANMLRRNRTRRTCPRGSE